MITLHDKLTDYMASKASGLSRIDKIEEAKEQTVYKIARKQFSPSTGEELEERVVAIDRAELLSHRAQLVARIEAIDNFLKEADAAQEAEKA